MDQPPGPSNEPDALDSDSENVSNATDDQHYDSKSDSDPTLKQIPLFGLQILVE